ncbi:MAG: ABC transporter substrate-binding protein [Burkholderiaceae bacterium]
MAFRLIPRRTLLAGVGFVTLALGLSALALPPAMAQSRKVLVVASGQDIPNFDPHVASGYSSLALLRNVYDPLVRIDGNPPSVVPALAESWLVSDDGREYLFRLRTDAQFHDGSPVTAEAVKYSLDRLMRLNKGSAWMFTGIMGPDDAVSVINTSTVKFKLNKPFAAFLQVMPWLFIVNPKEVEANKGNDDGQTYLRKTIAGSGPFKVRRNEPGNLYEIERVPTYWKKQGAGNVSNVFWRIARETTTQRLMLEKGEAHMAMDLTSEDIDALRNKPGVVTIVETEFRTFSIKMNTQNGPLQDLSLRKAVAYAFDYEAMKQVAGLADLMVGPLPTGIFGHDPKLAVPRTDLKKAKEFLAKSKFPNGGVKLSINVVSGLDQQRKYALVLLDSLKKLNIELDIKPMVWPDMVASTKTPATTADFFPVYQTANYADPDNIAYAAYHGSRNGNWQNPTYRNPKVNDLLDRARGERNPAARAKLYQEVQRVIVDDAPDIFGALEKRKLAVRAELQHYRYSPIASNAPEFFALSLK